MALFQKFQNIDSNTPLYTVGLNKTILIIGLGNIGPKFELTRHNIGFATVDYFVTQQNFGGWIDKKDLKCHFTDAVLGNTHVIVIKPTTLMNLSGDAVQAVTSFYKLIASNVVVVHDELDIDFGQIRTRIGGGSAGHNGLKSIIGVIGEDFNRVRIGIGPKVPDAIDSADFVLGKFSKSEQENLKPLNNEVAAILTELIFSDKLIPETRNFII